MADRRLRSDQKLEKKMDPEPQVSQGAQEHDPDLRRANRAEADDGRDPTAARADTRADERLLTDEERLDAFRMGMLKGTLPDLPTIAGYHTCWLTTTNPRDPIHGRLRLGYELIKASEIPGWDHSTLKTGEYAGCVGVNEMLAAKLPLRLYQMYMAEVHYDAPNREAGKLTANIDLLKEKAASVRGAIIEEPGNQDLRQIVPRPDFTRDEPGHAA